MFSSRIFRGKSILVCHSYDTVLTFSSLQARPIGAEHLEVMVSRSSFRPLGHTASTHRPAHTELDMTFDRLFRQTAINPQTIATGLVDLGLAIILR